MKKDLSYIYPVDKDGRKVIDGEIAATEATNGADTASTLVTITNLIQNYLSQINETSAKLKEHRQMIEDALNSDETYNKHAQEAKAVAKIKLATKKQLMSQPNMRELAEKVKDLSADLKAARESLSSYLQQYHESTGSNQFEDASGEVLDIVTSVRLVRVSSRS